MASKQKQKQRGGGRAAGQTKNYFSVFTKILVTNEVFRTKGVYGEMKISDLKGQLEFTIGIPKNLQRLSYLDEGDLLDHTDVKYNDIVPGGTLHVRVWPMWSELIDAVVSNDIDKVFSLGVTQDTDYKTPNSEYMTKRAKKVWIADRAFVALCVAAHRGHALLVKRLIKAGANVNSATPEGKTPLHIAASQGHGHIVDALLETGADIDAVDKEGMTALMRAEQFGHKACGRHLFLFRWQQRAKKITPTVERPLMAHQLYDSAYPVWRSGQQCQLYVTKIPPPGEFDGTGINAKPFQPYSAKSFRMRFGCESNQQTSAAGEEKQDILPPVDTGVNPTQTPGPKPPSFDEWLKSIKQQEQRVRLKKQRSEEKRKQEEDDRKRAESEKNQSYDSWLAQQEMEKLTNRAQSLEPGLQDKTSHTSYTRPGSQRKGALREYLESLAGRKGGSSYSDWLLKKELEMLDSVQARPVLQTK